MATTEKSNKCSFCGRGFLLKSSLKTHELKCKREKEGNIVEEEIDDFAKQVVVGNHDMYNVDDEIFEVVEFPEEERSKGKRPYVCEICGKEYNLKSSLKTHLIGHDSPKPLVCSVCDRKFTNRRTYQLHVFRHMTKKDFQCSVCKKEFPSQKLYDKHICKGHISSEGERHISSEGDISVKAGKRKRKNKRCKKDSKTIDQQESGPSHFEAKNPKMTQELCCKLCYETFSEKSVLEEHRLRHKEELKCVKCNKKCTNLISLRYHVKTHLKKENVQCELCGKVCRKTTYPIHMRTHTGERPYECQECGVSFIQSAHLRMHMKFHTGNRDHQCEVCGKSYYSGQSLRKHLMLHSKSYNCNLCHETFSKWSKLHLHEKHHHADTLHSCHVCEEKFRFSSLLYVHYADHSEEELQVLDENILALILEKKKDLGECEICGKHFNKKHIKMHMKVHTSEEPYSCPYCDETFPHCTALSMHKKIHTEGKHFKCNICEKTFLISSKLKAHIAIHSNEIPFICYVCGKIFALENDLFTHKKIHMKDLYLAKKCKKVFECLHCGEEFASKRSHLTHEKSCPYMSEELYLDGDSCEFVKADSLDTYDVAVIVNEDAGIECVSTGREHFHPLESTIILKVIGD